MTKKINDFDFGAAEANETMIRDLATSDFLDHQPKLVLIDLTGTGKFHLAGNIVSTCIRDGRRGPTADLISRRHGRSWLSSRRALYR